MLPGRRNKASENLSYPKPVAYTGGVQRCSCPPTTSRFVTSTDEESRLDLDHKIYLKQRQNRNPRHKNFSRDIKTQGIQSETNLT